MSTAQQHPITLVWKRRRFVITVCFGALVLASGVAMILPQTFVSTSSFVIDQGSQATLSGGLVSIANQLGIGAASGGGSNPQFLARLAETRTVLEKIALSTFEADHGSQLLLEILRANGDTSLDSLEMALDILRKRISGSVDARTGLVSIRVEGRTAREAFMVDSAIIAEIIVFNNETRQTRSRFQRVFAEQRIEEVTDQFFVIEDSLRRFLEQNRSYENSPGLAFEAARLGRRVNLLQDVLTALSREAELSRIQERGDIPAITIVDSPSTPARRASPRRTRLVVLTTFFAGIIAIAYILWLEPALRRLRGDLAATLVRPGGATDPH